MAVSPLQVDQRVRFRESGAWVYAIVVNPRLQEYQIVDPAEHPVFTLGCLVVECVWKKGVLEPRRDVRPRKWASIQELIDG